MYTDWLLPQVALQLEDGPQTSVQSPTAESVPVSCSDRASHHIPTSHSEYDPSTAFDFDFKRPLTYVNAAPLSQVPCQDAHSSLYNHYLTLAAPSSPLPAELTQSLGYYIGTLTCSLPPCDEGCVSSSAGSYVAGDYLIPPIASASSELHPSSSIPPFSIASSSLNVPPSSIPPSFSGLSTSWSASTPFPSSNSTAGTSGSSSAPFKSYVVRSSQSLALAPS